MRRQIFAPLLFAALLPGATAAAAAAGPNILWITAEDMSPTLGCYGDGYAITPNIDRLAAESVRYTRAFATAPVCSPARSCLITGCYATSLATHAMRSAFPLPEKMRGFPALLRDAGYYTTNNAKTDYNTASWRRIVAQSWNESGDAAHWRRRPEAGRPFFSVFNLMTSHQSRSMVWTRQRFEAEVQSRLAPGEIHDPGGAPLPPYYPDTPIVRRTVARYYDCVTAMDKQVGAILQQLEDDGLTGDTIVFFYSDHGSGLPRHKRALLDSGMHVPLLIRFPEKYKQLAPAKPGETTDQLVSFVDFGPTVLSLAGLQPPEFMQGRPFLGNFEAAPRDHVFGHRDRVDEAIDLARSVRDRRYLYIRNYMPHLSYNQPTAWPDLGEIRHEFYRLADPNKMTAPQWHFAAPTRPVEELYDCLADPQNIRNLAESDEHRGTLQRLRAAHRKHIRRTADLGFLPEPRAWQLFGETPPWEAVRSGKVLDHSDALLSASHVGFASEGQLLRNLSPETTAAVRYWGATALIGRPQLSPAAEQALIRCLQDVPVVRIAAADALARHGRAELAVPVLVETLEDENLTVALYAARTIELLGDQAAAALPAMRRLVTRTEELLPSKTPATFIQSAEQDLAMFIGFAARGFLSRVAAN